MLGRMGCGSGCVVWVVIWWSSECRCWLVEVEWRRRAVELERTDERRKVVVQAGSSVGAEHWLRQ